jgi:CO/xanthine dehydrogenase FAD-binding subunit
MFHSAYLAPHSLEELLFVLHQHGGGAKVIAGGTDLVPQMRLGRCSHRLLVDPIRLPLGEMIQSNGDIVLGARFTHSQVLNSPLLEKAYPALVQACRLVGGPPVRNRGTLAGNLANASPAADSALPFLIYDAQVVAQCVDGERIIPLNYFYLGPGHTCLSADEFIREIRIPQQPPRSRAAFFKLGNRKTMAIAIASIAVRLSLDDTGRVKQARVALGSVAPMPLRAYQAEAILESNHLDNETIRFAAQATQQAASPISFAPARVPQQMVLVLTQRVLSRYRTELASENIDDD